VKKNIFARLVLALMDEEANCPYLVPVHKVPLFVAQAFMPGNN
jgi:hypothetical protein